MDILEERVRRSSRLRDRSAFKEFLAYACQVRDEDEVYFFMEENEVGLDEPEFWAAKLTMFRNKCEFSEFIKVIKQCKRDCKLKKHPKYWTILQVEREVENHLEKVLKNKVKSKRSAREYETLNVGKVEKETRKFGNIEVYVDYECRRQYRLEDLVDFITARLKDYCEYERNCYLREISQKPLSFISKNKDRLNELAADMFGHRKKRSSFMEFSKRTTVRGSFIARISNNVNPEMVNTPDLKKKSESKTKDKECSKENDGYEDSISNFKKAKKNLASSRKSRKSFIQIRSGSLEFNQSSIASSVSKENIRHEEGKGSELFLSQSLFLSGEKESLFDQFENFDNNFDFSCQSEEKRKGTLSQRSYGDEEVSILSQFTTDFAFIEQSQPETKIHSKSDSELNELDNIIKEIQMTKYDSQTMSEIDSNKENAELIYAEDSQSFAEESHQRKLFQTIRKDNAQEKRSRYFDNPESENGADSSSNMIKTELIEELKDNKKENAISCFFSKDSYSEKNKRKRISRISEEKSYSYSETKRNNRSGS